MAEGYHISLSLYRRKPSEADDAYLASFSKKHEEIYPETTNDKVSKARVLSIMYTLSLHPRFAYYHCRARSLETGFESKARP